MGHSIDIPRKGHFGESLLRCDSCWCTMRNPVPETVDPIRNEGTCTHILRQFSLVSISTLLLWPMIRNEWVQFEKGIRQTGEVWRWSLKQAIKIVLWTITEERMSHRCLVLRITLFVSKDNWVLCRVLWSRASRRFLCLLGYHCNCSITGACKNIKMVGQYQKLYI